MRHLRPILILALGLGAAVVLSSGCASENAGRMGGRLDAPVPDWATKASPSSPAAVVPASAGSEKAVEARPRQTREDLIPLNNIAQLRPGLSVSVTVLVSGEEEIVVPSRRVSDEGRLDLPLVGEVPVSGLVLQELEELLTERYSAYLVEPQVVTEFARADGSGISPWGYVTVLGRVNDEGKVAIPATRDLTVSGAIQQAGGLDTSARSNAIRVARRAPGGTVRRLRVDLKAFARGRLEEDIVLQAGDVVFVPESIW